MAKQWGQKLKEKDKITMGNFEKAMPPYLLLADTKIRICNIYRWGTTLEPPYLKNKLDVWDELRIWQ